jgi:murein DD-endopeptidase MepM/ murein hydrolase activator NlpD
VQYIDTALAGIGRIHAAFFRHMQNDYYAIPFVQDSVEDYYDIDGNSLRRVFLKAPLRYSRISSRYSHSRMHPILKIRRPHHGIDYAAPIGTPVHAVGDGEVIKAGYDDGGGYMLKIRHNSVYTTSYMHLSRYAKGIRRGSHVRQGDVIGYVGSSGLSTGPHLDFRFYRNNQPINPLKVKAPPVEPIKEENRQAFDSVKAITIRRLSASSL